MIDLRILWKSMTSTSFVITELANTMKYGGGFLHNLVFTEWRHCVSQNEVWGRGYYITLFSPSDVTAFHRILWNAVTSSETLLNGYSLKTMLYNTPPPYFFVSDSSVKTLQVKVSQKGLAQAKIKKQSVILFWLINMTIWCKHVHRLELQKFFLIFVLRIHQLG